MKISIATRGMPHQREWGEILGYGLQAHGIDRVMIEAGDAAETPIVACWGWRVGIQYRGLGHEVLVAERGYVGDRFEWFSLGWNGLNGRADFRTDGVGPERWIEHHAHRLMPWRRQDGYALLLGQVPGDAAVRHVSYKRWVRQTARALEAAGYEVRWRPHPQALDVSCPAPRLDGSLEEALAGAQVAVTCNSNSGVDAVLAGVPTVTMDAGAMAWAVSGREPGDIVTPDRTDWANRLAWSQWTLDEIADGAAWAHIGRHLMEAA